MVGSVEICHEEVHILSTEMVGGAKLDWQGDPPQRLGHSNGNGDPDLLSGSGNYHCGGE